MLTLRRRMDRLEAAAVELGVGRCPLCRNSRVLALIEELPNGERQSRDPSKYTASGMCVRCGSPASRLIILKLDDHACSGNG